jgi:hypothetical protein
MRHQTIDHSSIMLLIHASVPITFPPFMSYEQLRARGRTGFDSVAWKRGHVFLCLLWPYCASLGSLGCLALFLYLYFHFSKRRIHLKNYVRAKSKARLVFYLIRVVALFGS